jgi:hypothetical protein
MKLPSCLQKLRIPALGAVFGALALGLSAQSAHAVAIQGCVKVNGVLTPGVKVDVFDNSNCTRIASGVTFGAGGDFVIRDASFTANNQNIYVVFTTPDGCMEVVDNATIRCSIITDPNDVCRFGWAAFCTDILGAPVQCTDGISRVVLQYLGTSDQVVAAWATTSNSKNKTTGSKAGATKVSSKSTTAKASSKTTKPSSKSTSGTSGSKASGGSKAPAAPLYCNTLKPCSTFSIALPTSAPKGSKGVWKLGSKSNRSGNFLVKPGSKGIKAGSKGVNSGSKNGKKGSIGSLTLFVGNNVNTRIDVSCASGIAVGQVYGMFRVIRLEDASGNRICPAPKNPNCTTKVSPNLITFKYTGGTCATARNSQTRGSSYNCSDAAAPCTGSVKVVFSRTPSLTGKFYWTTIPVGRSFSVRAPSNCANLGPKLYAFIFNGSTQIECVQIDTSCSAPLIRGESFGGLQLVDYAVVN